MFAIAENNLVRQSLAILPAFINVFFFGCHQFWLSNAAFFLTQADNVPSATLTECGYIGSSLEFGKLVFAGPGAILIDKIGRKKAVVILGCLNTITWTALALGETLTLIYVIRFVAGTSIILCASTYIALIEELSSPEYRTLFSTIIVVPLWSSSIFQSTVSVIFSSYRAVAASTAALTLLFFPSTYFLLESPHFLISSGRYSQAKENMTILQPDQTTPEIEARLDALKSAIECERSTAEGQTLWPYVRQNAICGRLLCAVYVRGFHVLSGSLFLSSYMTVVLPPNRLLPNSAYPLVAAVVALLAHFGSAFAVEKCSRRPLFVVACAISSLTLSAESLLYYTRLNERHDAGGWAAIAGLILVVCVHAAFLSPLGESLASDLFPSRVKRAANAFSQIFRSFLSIVGFLLFDVVGQRVGVYGNFAIYASATLVLGVTTLPALKRSSQNSPNDVRA